MIDVSLALNNGSGVYLEIGAIDIKLDKEYPDDTADYEVIFHVDRAGAVGHHRRYVYGFARTKFNVLALLRLALETLDEGELSLEPDVGPRDLAGGQHRPRGTLSLEA